MASLTWKLLSLPPSFVPIFSSSALSLIQEQRPDQLQDVLFTGVVRAQVAARLGVHHRLEHGAEDGQADAAPVQRAGVQQQLAHGGVEGGQGSASSEQATVDVGEQASCASRVFCRRGGVSTRNSCASHWPVSGAVRRGALPANSSLEGMRGRGRCRRRTGEQQAHQQHSSAYCRRSRRSLDAHRCSLPVRSAASTLTGSSSLNARAW